MASPSRSSQSTTTSGLSSPFSKDVCPTLLEELKEECGTCVEDLARSAGAEQLNVAWRRAVEANTNTRRVPKWSNIINNKTKLECLVCRTCSQDRDSALAVQTLRRGSNINIGSGTHAIHSMLCFACHIMPQQRVLCSGCVNALVFSHLCVTLQQNGPYRH